MKFTSRPPTTISPESASSSPATTRRIVLLPQPDGPRRTRNSLSATCSETSLPASTFPQVFTRSSDRSGAIRLRSLVERARHRRLHEPALKDEEHGDRGGDRHHGRGGDGAPVG